MAFKMRGNPFQRNFDIGDPKKKARKAAKNKNNDAVKLTNLSAKRLGETAAAGIGAAVGGKAAASSALEIEKRHVYKSAGGSAMKNKADRIRGRKGGTVKNVTERLNEGDYKSARLERRGNVASHKGKKAKAQRLRRKADESSQKFFRDQVKRREEK